MSAVLERQTPVLIESPGYERPRVRFDPKSKGFSSVAEGITLRVNARANPLGQYTSVERDSTNLVPAEYDLEEALALVASIIGTGQRTMLKNAWGDRVTISAYEGLLEDYDVAVVEEGHMQAAKKYGW